MTPTPGQPDYWVTPTQVPRNSLATAVVSEMRLAELQTISDRLGRVERRQRASGFGTAAAIFAGAVAGAALGLPAFLGSADRPSEASQVAYLGLMGFALAVAFVCWLAASRIRDERADSIGDIKTDFDKMLESYETPKTRAGADL